MDIYQVFDNLVEQPGNFKQNMEKLFENFENNLKPISLKRKIFYCVHNTEQRNCKRCRGKNICCHNKRKQYCRECGGSQICIHDKIKHSCKFCCNPSQLKRQICFKKNCNNRSCKKYEFYCKKCFLKV